MGKRKERLYNGSDPKFLETTGVMRLMMEEHLDEFNAFDGSLNSSFLAEWGLKIRAAMNAISDHNARNVLAGYTAQVKKTVEECRDKYHEVNYFAKRAFKDKKEVIVEFGKKSYPLVKQNQGRMIELMQILYAACTKYETQLLAYGYTPAQIEQINTLATTLTTKNLEQEAMKTQREVSTANRIDLYNECYYYTKIVMDAAKVMYRKNPAKYGQFLFAKGSGRKKKSKEEQE